MKPHPEESTHLCEPVNVGWIVALAHVTNVLDESFSEVVTVLVEWIVLNAGPVMTEVVCDAVNFIEVEVGLADNNRLFKF